MIIRDADFQHPSLTGSKEGVFFHKPRRILEAWSFHTQNHYAPNPRVFNRKLFTKSRCFLSGRLSFGNTGGMTRFKFEWWSRLLLAGCVLAAFWAIYASAQTVTTNTTTPPPGEATNATIANKLADLEQTLAEHDPLFHLDRISVLHEYSLFGQPYWKYIASLIY